MEPRQLTRVHTQVHTTVSTIVNSMLYMDDWWIHRIEGLKKESEVSDVGLAKRLDISPAMLAHVRMGRRALPLHARIRLLDALGYVITSDMLLRILPEQVRSALVETNALSPGVHPEAGEPDPNSALEIPPTWR